MGVLFYLGTHNPHWLWQTTGVPLFVSHNRLKDRRTFGRANTTWGLDSGAFTELSQHGKWRTGPEEWVDHVNRYESEVGNLAWAAPQDWMCEPFIIDKTGLSVREHQERTVQNYLDLKGKGPFVPVLQGWMPAEYHAHVDMYLEAGVDLAVEPVVGIGSVCRRQSTMEIGQILRPLHERGIRLHGFGIKKTGMPLCRDWMISADSMAWSYEARYAYPLPGCKHRRCANCLRYALKWRAELLMLLDHMRMEIAA